MADWDSDSERLKANLRRALYAARESAAARVQPTVEQARSWQRAIMRGLAVPNALYIGRFRGEPGLEDCDVEVAEQAGAAPADVAAELMRFESKLQETVGLLDGLIGPEAEVNADAAASAMRGQWRETVPLFREMYQEALQL